MNQLEHLQNLEKANRVLQKKLQRSELNRIELEQTNELKEALLRKVIQELQLSEKTIEEKNQILQRQAEELAHAFDELQRTQAQLVQSEKMSSLGQLVAGVAHEINNPTNFIYGNLNYVQEYTQNLMRVIACYQKHYSLPASEVAELIEDLDLTFLLEDFPKLLNSMQSGAERIREIVSSLRTFSRLDEAEVKAVNLHEGIDSTLLILGHRLKAQANRLGIQVIKEYDQLPLIECCAGQLNQVFMNILSNAIDALEEKMERLETTSRDWKPVIKVCTAFHAAAEPFVRIRIADNGPGIAEVAQQRLFDPFFTTKPVGKGTGLGLSISYQVVTERHGGNLTCQSAPGAGTEFVIDLPLKPIQKSCPLPSS